MTEQSAIVKTLTGGNLLAEFAKVCPAFCDPSTLARVALTQFRRTPKLARVAEINPAGFYSALMDCAQTGLVPDGRYAHLVPYEGKSNTVQFIADWKGLVMLGMQSDKVRRWRADVVHANDHFRFSKGRVAEHDIDYSKSRGDVIGYYSEIVYQNEEEDAEFVTLQEARGIQARSQAGDSGPWKTDTHEMGKKTAIKRHSKRLGHILNKTFELALTLDADRLPEIDVTTDVHASAPTGKAAAILNVAQPAEAPTGQETPTPAKRKGRPRGSKNRPKPPPYEPCDGLHPAPACDDPVCWQRHAPPEPKPEPEPLEDENQDNEPPPVTDRDNMTGTVEKHLAKIGAIRSKQYLDQWGLEKSNWRQVGDPILAEMAAEAIG